MVIQPIVGTGTLLQLGYVARSSAMQHIALFCCKLAPARYQGMVGAYVVVSRTHTHKVADKHSIVRCTRYGVVNNVERNVSPSRCSGVRSEVSFALLLNFEYTLFGAINQLIGG